MLKDTSRSGCIDYAALTFTLAGRTINRGAVAGEKSGKAKNLKKYPLVIRYFCAKMFLLFDPKRKESTSK